MLGRLVLLFVMTTLIELWLLMLVNEHVGITGTISLVLITGFVGASLAKQQGLQTWQAIHRETQQGRMPAAALIDGLMIFVASILLITPGILTDFVGFSLLVPPVRAFLRARFRDSFKVQASASVQGFGASFSGTTSGSPAGPQPTQHVNNDVIDVEFHRHTED